MEATRALLRGPSCTERAEREKVWAEVEEWEVEANRLRGILREALGYTGVDLEDTAERLSALGAPTWVVAARVALVRAGVLGAGDQP